MRLNRRRRRGRRQAWKRRGALAWEQEPRRVRSGSRPFFGRGVGSSILASLSEAGGNDLRQPANKPLPPRSPISVGRHSERTLSAGLQAAGQSEAKRGLSQVLCILQTCGNSKSPQVENPLQNNRFGILPPASGIRTPPRYLARAPVGLFRGTTAGRRTNPV